MIDHWVFLYFQVANHILVDDEMESFHLERRTTNEFWFIQ